MASYLLRRSGIAVGLIADLLDWRADMIYHVGLGTNFQETDVLSQEWPGVEWVGFEPHPQLVKWAIEKDYPGEIFEVAVGAEQGEGILYSKHRHKDGSSMNIHRDAIEGETYTEIKVKKDTLDNLVPTPHTGRIMLWLDCEGHELEAMKGGVNLLAHTQVVNIEMTARPPGDGWCTPNEVHKFLMDHNFNRQWIHTQRTNQGQYDGIYVKPEIFRPQFCCCPCQTENTNINVKGMSCVK
jgi:FkbM family methyltransferase